MLLGRQTNVSAFLLERHKRLGKFSDLNNSILISQHAADVATDDDPVKLVILNNLSVSLQRRFDRLGELADLDGIVSSNQGLLKLMPDHHPSKSEQFHTLGMSLGRRFERRADLRDLDDSILMFRRAIELVPDGHLRKPMYFHNLAVALHHRFEHLGELHDIDDTIVANQFTVELTGPDDDLEAERVNNLSVSFYHRFELIGGLDDFDMAMALKQYAIELFPDNHPQKAEWQTQFALALGYQYERSGSLDDLEKNLSACRRALDLTPHGHPDMSDRLFDLGVSLVKRFRCLGELDDHESALSAYRSAADLMSDDYPAVNRLQELAELLSQRYHRLGILDDLQSAIKASRHAIELQLDEDPAKAQGLVAYAYYLDIRFQRLGGSEDLDNGIYAYQCALELTPDDDPNQSERLYIYGDLLGQRFMRQRRLDDIANSIAMKRCAIELLPDEDTKKLERLDGLAVAFNQRYEHYRDPDDLSHSISIFKHVIETSRGDHPAAKATQLKNLGERLHRRHERLGQLADLEDAISTYEHVLRLTSDDDPLCQGILADLGTMWHSRFDLFGIPNDLEIALSYERRSIELAPDGSSKKPIQIANYGRFLKSRFMRFTEVSDLNKAILTQKRALELMPDNDRDKLAVSSNFVETLQTRYRYLKDPDDLEPVEYYVAAAGQPLGDPLQCLKSVAQALRLLALGPHESSMLLLSAFSLLLNVIPEVVWLGYSLERRFAESSRIGEALTAAVSAVIRAKNLELALEGLEVGRTIVWSQVLSLRTPIDNLRDCRPDLALALQDLHALFLRRSESPLPLHTHTSAIVESGASENISDIFDTSAADQLRQLAIKYKQLLAEIRSCDGFGDFLRPKPFQHLMSGAEQSTNGPVIFVNIFNQCDALIIEGSSVRVKELPALSGTFVDKLSVIWQGYLQASNVRGRAVLNQSVAQSRKISGHVRVLEQLWTWIVRPIFEALDLVSASSGELVHITWCPTGSLTQLPLHAAGIYSESSGPRAFDFAVSSYTPSLTALLNCRAELASLHSAPSMLVVTQSETPGQKALPSVEDERVRIHQLLSETQISSTVLSDHEATVHAVHPALTQHSWVHLSCHASQNAHDPTQSAFHLHDGPLTLRTLMGTELVANAELAFLSACQTATGDWKIPEESAHLAAGMLAVGFKGVVASMWSIQDRDAPMVVEEYYKRLLELRRAGVVGKRETGAAHALHEAVKRLRADVGEQNFIRWAPFVHFGA
ncbi:hypothetical protein PENSPDRAFT_634330 [Peniophora sp. CONT]|nr:hypothetical protein PENSPDRAFT_634330 [Peniophora sp. CONT]